MKAGEDRDQSLMRAYLRDDPEAFARIYATYADAVYGYLVKRVRTEEERDDLFQRIWMKFHRSRDRWSPEYPLLQWLFVIARSVHLDARRAGARSPFGAAAADSDGELAKLPAAESAESAEAEEAELAREMVREGLTEEQAEVVRSRVFADEEYAEIAERLGKSAVSVRKIFSRAIERLRIARLAGRNR